jgi:hypothetical protein
MVFANVTMVLLGVGLAVRRRDLVAMQAAYEMMPATAGARARLPVEPADPRLRLRLHLVRLPGRQEHFGQYWELGMLSRSYPMMILPVAGVLISPPVSRCSAKTFVS